MAAGGEPTVLEKLEDLNKLISFKVENTNKFIVILLGQIDENEKTISNHLMDMEKKGTTPENVNKLKANINKLTKDNAEMTELIHKSTEQLNKLAPLEDTTWRDVIPPPPSTNSTVGGKSKKLRKYSKIHTINKRKTTRKNKKHQTGGYKADYKINNSKWLNKKLYPRSSRVSRPRVSRPRSRGSPNKHK